MAAESWKIAEAISTCRLCYSERLEEVLSLGEMALTGVFPTIGQEVPSGPLTLMRCKHCGLVQLGHSYPSQLLYGPSYGYRSGLNPSMVQHLNNVAEYARRIPMSLGADDLIVDIGSNDGTLLAQYPQGDGTIKIGIDPLGEMWRQHYLPGNVLFSDFFKPELVLNFTRFKAKIVTTIACFYDMPEPCATAAGIIQILDQNGIWIAEQSYLPAMCEALSFDTICHEHLEYYQLHDFDTLCTRMGLRIIDVVFTDTNGGSFLVAMCHHNAPYKAQDRVVDALIWEMHWRSAAGVDRFVEKVKRFPERMLGLMYALPGQIFGYGASTKGNVLLQYCHFDKSILPMIADRNPMKWGLVTPGTGIPIVSEQSVRELNPDFLFVLPWHFRESIKERERAYTDSGGCLVYPLPEISFDY